jgi:hypothetical protein
MAGPINAMGTNDYTLAVLNLLQIVNAFLPYANLAGANGDAFEEQFAGIVRAQKQRSQAVIDRENAAMNQTKEANKASVETVKNASDQAASKK